MELAVVPIYQSEIVPGQARGFIIATYQVSLVVSVDSECKVKGMTLMDNLSDWLVDHESHLSRN